MSGEIDPKVTVDIGLGAKASLEVSTEIPARRTSAVPYCSQTDFLAEESRDSLFHIVGRKGKRTMQILSAFNGGFLGPTQLVTLHARLC